MKCRHCNADLIYDFIDLGFAPPSNAYLSKDDLKSPEKYYPLLVKICHCCWLAQTEDSAEAGEYFNSDYAYFSSTSKSWLLHASLYTDHIIDTLNLNADNFVIEIASNDGYLLKNFISKGIPCLGIEPTDSTAFASEQIGVPVLREFFSEKLADKLLLDNKQADLIIGNNVYAHVPDINDFTRGLKKVLKKNGTITLEFPHLMRLLEYNQFDTIYHEHFSYLSLTSVSAIFFKAGLRIYDVEELTTHGGSLRVYGCHEFDQRVTSNRVIDILGLESERGLQDLNTYISFQEKANIIKDNLLTFLIEQKRCGKKVVAYGAAAKGNTLLNYAGIKSDLIKFVYDGAKSKQNKFMPGSHIPILEPDRLNDEDVDYILILPWNISHEIINILKHRLQPNVNFVVCVPSIQILTPQ